MIVDPGPWYEWPLETLGCHFRMETWDTRSLIESLFFVLKCRLWRFYAVASTPPVDGVDPSPRFTTWRSYLDTSPSPHRYTYTNSLEPRYHVAR